MTRERTILILAGPNGAGKTTFAREFLVSEAECPTFVNADLIAAGLSPFNPAAAAVRASRVMLQLIADHVRRGERYPSAESALARVARRIQQGGHAIPDEVVRRRFDAGRRNLEQVYKTAVDDWALYDNAGPVPVLLDWGENR